MSPTIDGGHDEIPRDVRSVAVLAHTARWILPAYALLFLTFLTFLDPGGDPKIGLTGTVALIAWMFAESGRVVVIVVIATALVIVLVARPGPSRRVRLVEVEVMIAVSLLVLLGGSVLNDHVVKPAIGVARPDIVQLSDLGVLGIDVDSFYAMPKASRSEYLDGIKSDSGFGDLVMRPEVRDHWVKETAFSMPSGHALAAMTFATFYLSIALSSLSGWRRWPFYALVPWAVCVCLSRPILRVHRPADIVIGGLAGIVVGAGGFLLAHALLVRFERPSPFVSDSPPAARAG